MTKKEAIAELKKLQKSDDPEYAHCRADGVLRDMLTSLGCSDVVEAYDNIKPKWYA